MSEDSVIDLTDSFSLADHCALSDIIIDLVGDDSFNLSADNVNNKHKSTTVKKQEPNSKSKNAINSGSSIFGDCPICWEELGNNPLASTICGHVYCLKCLESSLQITKRCPTCRNVLRGKVAYHPLYITVNIDK